MVQRTSKFQISVKGIDWQGIDWHAPQSIAVGHVYQYIPFLTILNLLSSVMYIDTFLSL